MVEIKSAHYISDYRLELEFSDGMLGRIDFRDYLQRGGVFARFQDMVYFKSFFIDPVSKTLAWPDGIDIDPEMLYHKATGAPLPEWAR
ncbi:MAG: hypothetical protein A2Y33_04655 [Spirochaetes bacterium GWF1_51_8]|nr:MAG: hypothetical protein A2Y33_04655 [Spirochaetes bacterium GWF1_51_8]